MNEFMREENSFGANPGTKDLARHLYTRMFCGKVVIVASNPITLLPALRKQWLKLARKNKKELASTLNTVRIYELNELLTRMLTLQFTTKWPASDYPADVYIVTNKQLLEWAPECRTLYITCDITPERLYVAAIRLQIDRLIVICKLA